MLVFCISYSVNHGHSTLDCSWVVVVGRNEEKALVQWNRHVGKIQGFKCLAIMNRKQGKEKTSVYQPDIERKDYRVGVWSN